MMRINVAALEVSGQADRTASNPVSSGAFHHRLAAASLLEETGGPARTGPAFASRGPAPSRSIFVAIVKVCMVGGRSTAAFLLTERACQHGEHGGKLLEALHHFLHLADVADDAVNASHLVDEAFDVAHIVDPSPPRSLLNPPPLPPPPPRRLARPPPPLEFVDGARAEAEASGSEAVSV